MPSVKQAGYARSSRQFKIRPFQSNKHPLNRRGFLCPKYITIRAGQNPGCDQTIGQWLNRPLNGDLWAVTIFKRT